MKKTIDSIQRELDSDDREWCDRPFNLVEIKAAIKGKMTEECVDKWLEKAKTKAKIQVED